jgi:hypothetical protein
VLQAPKTADFGQSRSVWARVRRNVFRSLERGTIFALTALSVRLWGGVAQDWEKGVANV